MNNNLKIIGDCYKKFGLKHTSKSTATLPHSMRFFKKHCLTPKEANSLSNAALTGGTVLHMIVQEVLTKNLSLDDVIKSELIQTKIAEYDPFNEKDKLKFKFIIENAKETAQNHLKNIQELPKQKWQDEAERTIWTPPVQTYWLLFIDLVGETGFGYLKNKFGRVTKTKKKGYSYSAVKMPDRPFFSDILQISLYRKACPLKPFLSYASHTDRKLFTEENCEDLKKENLDKHLKKLMIYEIAWQKKLEVADGDIKKLAWLCPPDYSDIKKNSFWFEGVPKEYIKRYLDYYAV